MAGHNAVGTPSGARRCSADGKIALGLQSQTSVRQAARIAILGFPRNRIWSGFEFRAVGELLMGVALSTIGMSQLALGYKESLFRIARHLARRPSA
jgi:hypothetical protein